VNKRLPNPVEATSEIKQIEASARLEINHEPTHVEVARIDRMIRKGTSRRINGTTRLGK
jgi:hypothetical protein